MRGVYRYLLLGALLAAAALAFGLSRGSEPLVLTVTDEAGRSILAVPVRQGERVELGFTHSSERVRVVSVFQVEGQRLRVVETRMEGFGPGLPADAGLAGGVLVSSQRPAYEEIVLRVSPFSAHWLAAGGWRLDLSAAVPEGHASFAYSLRLKRSDL
ncbi:MAG: DUF1850 domain-containing protein [Bacillota bacterium]